MAALMGIDVGTGSVKVELSDETGRRWSASSAPYGIDVRRPGWAEQDPETWWEAVRDTAARVWSLSGLPAGQDVTVAFTGQMHSLVLLDGAARPLRPAILWCDARATREAEDLGALPDVVSITGNTPLPAFTLPQAMWVRRHDPDAFGRATNVLLPKDYVRFRATGGIATDWTDASATGAFDVTHRRWSDEVLQASRVPAELFPPVHEPARLAGRVRGLLPETVAAHAVVGVGDQFAEALSAGLVDPGPLVTVLGTSGVLLGVRTAPARGVFCHAPEDRWLQLDSLHAAGLSLTWFRNTFAPDSSFDALVAEAATVRPGADGLVFLPFLAGDRRVGGTRTRSGFVGVRAEHTRAHFVRAVLEGVAFELRRIAETRMAISRPELMILKGGGARSRLWVEIIGAVFDAPTAVNADTAATGAMYVAGVATGLWTYRDAPVRTSGPTRDPDRRDVDLYADHLRQYVATAEAVGVRAPGDVKGQESD